jgi:nitronate monooxygenase
MKHLHTKICKLFGIRYPIILAGMAGGISTPELVAAVSRAGGLGTLGAAYMDPEKIRAAITQIRQLTTAPFAVNLFVEQTLKSPTKIEPKVQVALNQIRNQLSIPVETKEQIEVHDKFEQQFTILIEEKVPVISTAFGILSEKQMKQAKLAGMKVLTMVTTPEEAILAEEAGCDAIVAQGTEAGGHRGTFDITNQPMGANIALFTLLPEIVDQVSIPVIAAGGIMDGGGILVALALGAQAVQMGTRFLTVVESGAHPAYKQMLLASQGKDTVLTTAFSGRPARGIMNSFIKEWDRSGIEPMPFPIQNTLTRDIRDAASKQNNAQYLSLWAGQGVGSLDKVESAEAVMKEIINAIQQRDFPMKPSE